MNESYTDYEVNYSCSLCGDRLFFSDIQLVNDYSYLCHECNRRINDLPDGDIKNNVECFLIDSAI